MESNVNLMWTSFWHGMEGHFIYPTPLFTHTHVVPHGAFSIPPMHGILNSSLVFYLSYIDTPHPAHILPPFYTFDTFTFCAGFETCTHDTFGGGDLTHSPLDLRGSGGRWVGRWEGLTTRSLCLPALPFPLEETYIRGECPSAEKHQKASISSHHQHLLWQWLMLLVSPHPLWQLTSSLFPLHCLSLPHLLTLALHSFFRLFYYNI